MILTPVGAAELDQAAAFLQSGWWATFKGLHGWKSLGFRWTTESETGLLSVLLRTLPGGYVLAYLPHPAVSEDLREPISRALIRLLPAKTLCIRWDLLGGTKAPTETEGPDPLPPPLPKPFRKPAADVQPPDTVIVPLADEDTMKAAMHKKTRYNIGLAEKKGVRVERAGVEALGDWYELYRQTALRDRISIHSEKYYRDLFQFAPNLTLWLARFEGQILAGNIVLIQGTTATYLYGASGNEHRNFMAPYALQWAAMRDAQNQGCLDYDLFGIPPSDDPQHPMHGLYRFKNGFGGVRVHRPGAWDWVLRPFVWRVWTAADRLRVWYHKVWKKR